MSISTQQGGATSPVLWLIMVNEILDILGRIVMKVCAEDSVILVSRMFPFITSDIMEGTLGKTCVWSARCRLGINSTKVELMLFATQIRALEIPG